MVLKGKQVNYFISNLLMPAGCRSLTSFFLWGYNRVRQECLERGWE